jgi:hypothetical protein
MLSLFILFKILIDSNQTSLITLEINLWPLYPIQNALKCFDYEYNVWDLISKYNKKPLSEIGEIIYNMKSTYFEYFNSTTRTRFIIYNITEYKGN